MSRNNNNNIFQVCEMSSLMKLIPATNEIGQLAVLAGFCRSARQERLTRLSCRTHLPDWPDFQKSFSLSLHTQFIIRKPTGQPNYWPESKEFCCTDHKRGVRSIHQQPLVAFSVYCHSRWLVWLMLCFINSHHYSRLMRLR